MTSLNSVGLKSDSINFQAGNKNNIKAADNKPSNDSKMRASTVAMLGLTAVGLAILGGLGVKKGLDIKAANKAMKEAANAVGMEDVNLYKQLKGIFGKVSKHEGETLEWENIVAKVNKMASEGVVNEGDSLLVLPPIKVQEFALKHGTSAPENAVAIVIQSAEGKLKNPELILNKKIGDSFFDFVPKDKVYIIDTVIK